MNQFYIKCRINFILWDAFGIFYFNYSFSLSLPIIIIFFSIKIIWFAWGRCLTFCLAWNLFIPYNLVLSLIFYSRSSSKFILSWTWIIFPWRFNFWSSYKNGYWSPSRSPRFDDPVSWNDLPPIWEDFLRSHTSAEFFRSILKLFCCFYCHHQVFPGLINCLNRMWNLEILILWILMLLFSICN